MHCFLTFHPKSNEIKNEVVSDLFANSDIDMTTEEFGKFAKNLNVSSNIFCFIYKKRFFQK